MSPLKRTAHADASPLGKRADTRIALQQAPNSTAQKILNFAAEISHAVPIHFSSEESIEGVTRFSPIETSPPPFTTYTHFFTQEKEDVHTEEHPLWKLCHTHPLADLKEVRLHLLRIKKLPEKEQHLELYFCFYYLTHQTFPTTSASLLEHRCNEIAQELRALQAQWTLGEPSIHWNYVLNVLVQTLILPSNYFLLDGVHAARALLPTLCNPEFYTCILGPCPIKTTRLIDLLSDIELHFHHYHKAFEPLFTGRFIVHSSLHSVVLLAWGLPSTENITPLRTAWTCLSALFQPIRQTYEDNCFLVSPLQTLSFLERLEKILGYLSSGCIQCKEVCLPLAPLLDPYLYDPQVTFQPLPPEQLDSHPVTARITKHLSPISSLTKTQHIPLHFPKKWQNEVRQLLTAQVSHPLSQMLIVAASMEYLNAPCKDSPRNLFFNNVRQKLTQQDCPITDIVLWLQKHVFLYPFSTRIIQPDTPNPTEHVKFLVNINPQTPNIYCETFESLFKILQEINACYARWLTKDLFFDAMPPRAYSIITRHTPLSFRYNQGGYTDTALQLIYSLPIRTHVYDSRVTPHALLIHLHQQHRRSLTQGYAANCKDHTFLLSFPFTDYSEEDFATLVDSLPRASRPATELLSVLTPDTLHAVMQRLHFSLPIEKISLFLTLQKKPYHPFFIASSLHFLCQAYSVQISLYECYLTLCSELDLSPVIPCGDLNWDFRHRGVHYTQQYVFFYDPIDSTYAFGILYPNLLQRENSITDLYIVDKTLAMQEI